MARLNIGFVTYQHPPAPEDLPVEAREYWRAIIKSKPPTYWDHGNLPVLKEYVRAMFLCDRLFAASLSAVAQGDVVSAEKWTRLYQSQIARLISLAKAQRLPQSSDGDPRVTATAVARSKLVPEVVPWAEAS